MLAKQSDAHIDDCVQYFHPVDVHGWDLWHELRANAGTQVGDGLSNPAVRNVLHGRRNADLLQTIGMDLVAQER